jgi:DNA adenine methylase
MLKSPLRYPGGKSKAVKYLKQYIPDYFEEYREPFFGGGSFGLYILQRYDAKNIIFNDLNYNVFCFWKSLKNNPKFLLKNIKELYDDYDVGKDLYFLCKKNIQTTNDPLEIGTYFFILNRITFSGTIESGGFSQNAFDKRFTLSSLDRLEKISPTLSNVEIIQKDFEDVINLQGKNTFLYLDPPYYTAEKSKLYGKNGNLHKNFEHVRLFNTLNNTKHKWIMTYDDCEYIRELYKDYLIINWNLQYGMDNAYNHKPKNGKEILIKNF